MSVYLGIARRKDGAQHLPVTRQQFPLLLYLLQGMCVTRHVANDILCQELFQMPSSHTYKHNILPFISYPM
jgi:hypothetical protein